MFFTQKPCIGAPRSATSGALVPVLTVPKSDSIAILLINTNMKKYTLLPDYIFLSTVIGILRIPIGYRRYPIFSRLVMLVTNPRPPSNFYCSRRVAKRSSKESKFKSLRDSKSFILRYPWCPPFRPQARQVEHWCHLGICF